MGHCLGTIFLGGNCQEKGAIILGQSPSGQLSGGQLSREKFTSGAIVLEPLKITYLQEHLLGAASDFLKTATKHWQDNLLTGYEESSY